MAAEPISMEAAKPSPPPVLLRSLRNAVLTLQFNDPRRKNAWGKDLITSMLEALKEVVRREWPENKIVTVPGRGTVQLCKKPPPVVTVSYSCPDGSSPAMIQNGKMRPVQDRCVGSGLCCEERL